MMLFSSSYNSKNKTFAELCSRPKIHVNIAYNNEKTLFELNETSQEIIKKPFWIIRYSRVQQVWDYEIMIPFLKIYNIVPHWINCNRTWGVKNQTTGRWTGAVGQVDLILLIEE